MKDLVIDKGLTNCNANVMPIKAGLAIEMFNPNNYNKTDLFKDQCLIGKLIYLVCKTRPNIAFAIGWLNKHNTNPKKSHLQVAKSVVRYLKRIMQMELIYKQVSSSLKDSPPFDLKSCVDSNFAGDLENCKLVMSYCFFFNSAVVLWNSKKQRTVSISKTEAEYIILDHRAKEAMWIR